MTDIPRGQGGDGSPQLDLDAIEREWSHYEVTHVRCVRYVRALLASVRRLQQENEELRANAAKRVHEMEAARKRFDELRGRVEELTEALRDCADAIEDEQAAHECAAGPHSAVDTARALLARVDPEKETP